MLIKFNNDNNIHGAENHPRQEGVERIRVDGQQVVQCCLSQGGWCLRWCQLYYCSSCFLPVSLLFMESIFFVVFATFALFLIICCILYIVSFFFIPRFVSLELRPEGPSETASLPPRGGGKVCLYSTLPKPHLCVSLGMLLLLLLKMILSGNCS